MVETHYEGLGSGDLDGALSVFHDDVATSMPGAGTLRGLDAFRAVGQAYAEAIPDGRFTIKSAVESGDTIAVEGVYTGTHTGPLRGPQGELPPTGRSVNLEYADFFRARGDKFEYHRVYFDQADFMAQLGVGEQPS
jgi:predicted ester cyclase